MAMHELFRKFFGGISPSQQPIKSAVVEVVESRLLFSGMPEYRGVNDWGVFGADAGNFVNTGGNMATWGVDIVRQDVPYFDRVPMVSGDVPVPEGDLDGLQETVDNVRTVLGQGAITILCPFNWDGQGQLMAGESPSSKTYFSAYKSRLTLMADQFKNQTSNVWLEVWNEPYQTEMPSQYADDMKQMITAIRAGGFNGKIVIPGAKYGGSESKILTEGQNLVDYDPQHNLAFDLHAYWDWIGGMGSSTNIERRLQKVLNSGLDVFFGEFGPTVPNSTNQMDVAPFITAVKNKHVTALAWNWANSDLNTIHNITNNAGGTLNNTTANFNWANQVKAYMQGTNSNLPGGWNDNDVASPIAGRTTYNGSTWTIKGSGSDIESTSDQFHFTNTPMGGSGTIVANVTSVQLTNNFAKAGVMIRNGTAANAQFAAVLMTPNQGVLFQARTSTGGTVSTQWYTAAPSQYLKLVRAGNTFTAYASANGSTYTQIGSPVTINMAANVNAGLAVSSHNTAQLCTATFDHVFVNTTPPPLTNANIGAAIAGSTEFDGTIWKIKGSGTDIYGTSDQFQFAHQSFTGNGTLTARVKSLVNTDPYAKAGVMFRDGTAANAPFAAVVVTAGQGIIFQTRTTAGAATTSQSVAVMGTPRFVRIVRNGTSFTAFYSTDGVSYTQLGSPVMINMASTVRAGLAVTSHNASLLTTAEFEDLSVV